MIEANIKPILCIEFITVFSAVKGSDLLKLWQSELKRLAAENMNNVWTSACVNGIFTKKITNKIVQAGIIK